jgi:hypothetical protein
MSYPKPLGRRPPSDWEHVDKYPLRTLTAAVKLPPVPVVLGTNWYSAFDEPVRDARSRSWWVARDGKLGTVRGGHCFAALPIGWQDREAAWRWYDQIAEGICVGEGWCRAMDLLNKRPYQPRPLYDWAQANDEYEDTPPAAGTSVRAGADFVRKVGMVRRVGREPQFVDAGHVQLAGRAPVAEDGIAAVRWATSADEVLRALGREKQGFVVFLNSWGQSYPRYTRMSAEVLDRLIREDGEAAIPTDR